MLQVTTLGGLPRWLSGKELSVDARDAVLILGSGRSPGGGNGNIFQYSCLGNSMDRGAWWATVHAVTKVRHNLMTASTRQPWEGGVSYYDLFGDKAMVWVLRLDLERMCNSLRIGG